MATTLCAAGLRGSVDPGQMALALVYTLSLNGQFQWAVRESAETENYMTSFERMVCAFASHGLYDPHCIFSVPFCGKLL
jgi:hypothetical protein